MEGNSHRIEMKQYDWSGSMEINPRPIRKELLHLSIFTNGIVNILND